MELSEPHGGGGGRKPSPPSEMSTDSIEKGKKLGGERDSSPTTLPYSSKTTMTPPVCAVLKGSEVRRSDAEIRKSESESESELILGAPSDRPSVASLAEQVSRPGAVGVGVRQQARPINEATACPVPNNTAAQNRAETETELKTELKTETESENRDESSIDKNIEVVAAVHKRVSPVSSPAPTVISPEPACRSQSSKRSATALQVMPVILECSSFSGGKISGSSNNGVDETKCGAPWLLPPVAKPTDEATAPAVAHT